MVSEPAWHSPELRLERTAGRRQFLSATLDRPLRTGMPGRFAHHPAARLPSRRCGTSGMHLIGRRKLPGISVTCPRTFFPQPPEPLGRHTVHRRRFRHTEQRLSEHRYGHIGKTAPDGWQEGRHHQSRGRTERAHKDPDTSTEDRQFKKRNRSGEYPLSWYRDKENECFFGS